MEEEKLNNLIYLLRIHHIDSEPLENLIKRNKELEEHNEENIKALEEWINGERISIHCLPKSKVKEKIEELNKVLNKELKENEGYYTDETIVYDEQIQVLQELLQEGDK